MTARMLVTTLALFAACAGFAEAAPIVPGFERFGRSDTANELEAGLLLLGELGCANCHTASEPQAAHLTPPQPPRLGGEATAIGRRLRPKWLATYLADPHAAKPGTTMPQMLAGLDDDERSATVEALTHFLAATGEFDTSGVSGGGDARAGEGRKLYRQVGCAVCHGPLDGPPTLPDQLPLGDVAARWSPAALDAFLADPFSTHPSGRMPKVPLSDPLERSRAINSAD